METTAASRAPSVFIACVFILTAQPAAQPAWEVVAVSGSAPGARQYHAMAYDSQRDRVVMFGGTANVPYGDTWEWDGSAWTLVTTSGPSPRFGSAMVYDSQRGVCVMFGGTPSGGSLGGTGTWEWDGLTWTQVATTGPAARQHHAMAYDSQRGRTVLYGGFSTSQGYLHDTWEWTGTTWLLRSSGGTASEPLAAMHSALSYDSHRGKTVMFGGKNPSGPIAKTWEWDGTQWTLASGNGPAPRYSHAMTYDSIRHTTVLFGGVALGFAQGDTWTWDGSTWTQAASFGPSPRFRAQMAANHEGAITLFGGYETGVLGDTWEWSSPADIVTFGWGCGATQTNPAVGANMAGGNLNLNQAPVEFGILLSVSQTTYIDRFEVYTCSTGGNETVLAHIYRMQNGASYGSTPMTIGANPDFYAAAFPTAITLYPGTYLLAVDASAQNVVLPDLANGTPVIAATRLPGGQWSFVPAPVAWRAYFAQPVSLDHVGLPKLGTSYDITLSGALPNEIAVLMTGFSRTSFAGINLPFLLPTTNGCAVYVAPQFNHQTMTSSTGEASCTIAVPSSTGHIGTTLYHQWVVFDPINSLGLITSNAGEAFVWF